MYHCIELIVNLDSPLAEQETQMQSALEEGALAGWELVTVTSVPVLGKWINHYLFWKER